MSTLNSLNSFKAKLFGTAPKKPVIDQLTMTALLSDDLGEGPTDLVELRQPTTKEQIVQNIRGPLMTTAKTSLPLIGAMAFGPIGLGIGIAARTAISYLDKSDQAPKDRIKQSLVQGAFAGIVGTVGLIPGVFGLIAGAGTMKGLDIMASRVQKREEPFNINLEKFANSYLPKMEKKLGGEQKLQLGEMKGLSPAKREKLAAQALLSATKICCEQLSPTVAVALARETAQQLIPAGSAQENLIEEVLTSAPSKPLTDNILISDIEKDSPAAATAQHVLVTQEFLDTNSEEAVFAAVSHELSHVENRDAIGKLGDATLKNAMNIAGDQSLNPADWKAADQTLSKVELASAELSREREYRCDREGASKLLDSGLSKERISKGFRDALSKLPGSPDPLAEHPLTKDRLAAVDMQLGIKPLTLDLSQFGELKD